MKLLRSYPMMSFALVLLSIVALCIAQGSTGLLVVSGALAALSWYITEGPRSKHLPRWVSNLLVIAVSLHVVVDLAQNRAEVLGVLGRFMVLLTLIKLYERRTPRDHAQLLTLSMLLMVTGCLQSSDLVFGAMLVVYAVLGMYVLLLHQLYASFDQSRHERLSAIPAGYRLAPSVRPVTGRRLGLQFRGYVAGVMVIGLALSVLVFVLFPRGVGEGIVPTLEAPSTTKRAMFAPDINLLTGTRITDSRSVALQVTVLDTRGREIDYGQPLLLRGSVLERYQGNGIWTPSNFHDREVIELEEDRVTLAPEPLDVGRALMKVHVEPYIRSNVLFSPYLPCEVQQSGAQSLRFDESTQLVRSSKTERTGAYTVAFQPNPSATTLEQYGIEIRRARHMHQSEIPATVRDLARKILRDNRIAPEPPGNEQARWMWNQQAAAAFHKYFQTGFSYTLDLSDVVRRVDLDPVEQFLTETKRGHCEYYASAMTMMCQSVGVRARVVTGFVAYDFDPASMSYTVLQSNAHAWVEVQTGERRFTAFDPTPGDTLQQMRATQASITDRLRWVYERFDGAWSSRIVEFDREAQSGMQQAMDDRWSQRLTGGLDSIRDWANSVNRAFQLGPSGYIWLGLVGIAMVIAAVAVVKIAKRLMMIRRKTMLRHVHGAEYQRLLRQLGFYVDMLKVLDRAKVPKPVWQPPMSYAMAMQSDHPEAGRTMAEISELFYAARYGGKKLDREELQDAHRKVSVLANTFGVRAPK